MDLALHFLKNYFHEYIENLHIKGHHCKIKPYQTENSKAERIEWAMKWTSSTRNKEKTFHSFKELIFYK